MLKIILSSLLLFAPIFNKYQDMEKSTVSANPIYDQIVKNHPNINKKYAMKLSNKLHLIAKKYKINPRRYAAILAQESMYSLAAKNCRGDICEDFGIAQINKKTALAYGFNLEKLTSDLEYSLIAGAIVLADMKKMYNKEVDWWTRYNSSNSLKRKKYQTLVMRYW